MGTRSFTRRHINGAVTALLAPALAGPLAAACGLPGSGGEATARAPQGQVQISFSTDWSSGQRLKNIEDAMAIWKQKHPNIAVEVRAGGEVEAKLLADLAAGSQADVVLYGVPGIASLRQHFLDLAPFIKRDKFDMKDWLPVDPALLVQGGQYGMPFQYNIEGWLVNKTLFQRAGIPAPTEQTTWEEAAEAARRLTNRDQSQWGIEIGTNIARFLFRDLLWSNGGDFLSKDLKRTTLNTPEALDAARWIVDRLYRDKSVVDAAERTAVVPRGTSRAFLVGRIAMLAQNVGWVGIVETTPGTDQFEWDLMPAPRAPRTRKATYRVGDQPHAITRSDRRSAAQTDAAWVLTAFLSGPEVMALLADGRTSIPVHRKVLMGERYLRKPPASMGLVPKIVENSRFWPWFKGLEEWQDAMFGALQPGLDGKQAIEDALRAASAAGDAKLAELAIRG